ncbi:MAG: hypothetical protein RM338_25595 [Nostoc sp. DedQUE12a]|nr:hypothetical protein [Nostoc sp. DedQUE12a]
MSLPGHFPHRGIEHLLSIPMRILEFLQLLVELFSPDWKALGMYWPEVLTLIILCVLLILAFVYLGQILDHLSANVNNQQTPRKTASHYRKPRGQVSHSYRTDSKNRELQQELLTLLQWDFATAKRLLKRERSRHPNNSDNWYLEKVIWDLKRDRR